jgi:ribosome-binding protein aMBF1 (putative translation factor)
MKINLDKIDKELAKRGWSRYRLAHEMNIKPNTLYSILQNGSFGTVGRIAKILEVQEKDLVIGEKIERAMK